MQMIYHQTQSIDTYTIFDRQNWKYRIIYQIVFHLIEDIKPRSSALIDMVHYIIDKLSTHKTFRVADKQLVINILRIV